MCTHGLNCVYSLGFDVQLKQTYKSWEQFAPKIVTCWLVGLLGGYFSPTNADQFNIS